jgi:phosphohistidine phosphatase
MPGQSDFERPLNDRGLRDAPMMAQRLWEKDFRLDAIVSSPAVRAFATAKFFAERFGFSKKDIVLIDRLYHASTETFYDVISNELKDSWKNVAIFSHNPGITYFINSTGVVQLDNMPTCGVFGVEMKIDAWKDFEKSDKRMILFDYPKNG